jgi:hypothetical protein
MATRSLEDRVTALEKTVEGLQNLPGELAAFRREFESFRHEVNRRFDEQYAHMRLLHEEVISQIRILGEGRNPDEPPPPRRRTPKR